jgi:hypothetical protein
MNVVQLLEGLIGELKSLSVGDVERGSIFLGKVMLITKRTFGPSSEYIQQLDRKVFPSPDIYEKLENGEQRYKDMWGFAVRELLTVLHTMLEDIRLFGLPDTNTGVRVLNKPLSNRVFVVHGRDEEMKQTVARVLTKLGLEPIILHEQPDEGQTIIEKFSHYADVSFAVVLLSLDDKCYSEAGTLKDTKTRARQNVVFELGYFVGMLGRKYVRALCRRDPNFEMLSDYSGVLYITFEKGWEFNLVRELKSVGYDVSADAVL